MSARMTNVYQYRTSGRFGIVSIPLLGCAVFLAGCSGDARPLIEAVEVRELGIETLSIVPPENVILPLAVSPGERVDLSLTGLRADGVTVVDVSGSDRDWRVSDSTVGTIDGNGVFVARDDPTLDAAVVVSVGIGDVVASGFDIVVIQSSIQSLETIRGESTIDRCRAETYGVTAQYVEGPDRAVTAGQIEWSAAGPGVRLDEQENGSVEVVAANAGAITLTATVGGASTSLPIEVADSLRSIAIGPSTLAASVGNTQDLTATGTYDAGQGGPQIEAVITDNVTWSVATGSEYIDISDDSTTRGRVTVKAAGVAQVRANCGPNVEQLASYNALADDGSGDAISFRDEEDGVISISLSGAPVQLRASTGSDYDSNDDITFDSTVLWSTPDLNTPIIALQTQGSSQGTVTPLSVGRTRVEIRYDGQDASVIIDVR